MDKINLLSRPKDEKVIVSDKNRRFTLRDEASARGDDVDWLLDTLNLDLSHVARLGGDTAPCSFRQQWLGSCAKTVVSTMRG